MKTSPSKNIEGAKWRVVKRKSRAGVEYITYLPPLDPPAPKGFNYEERKVLDAIDKRQQEGREYYIRGKKGLRVYTKANEK